VVIIQFLVGGFEGYNHENGIAVSVAAFLADQHPTAATVLVFRSVAGSRLDDLTDPRKGGRRFGFP
jgi:hypothetical protein